jgi:hypothetical protein
MVHLDQFSEITDKFKSKYILITPVAFDNYVSEVKITYDIEHLTTEDLFMEYIIAAVADRFGLAVVKDAGALEAGVIKITVNALNSTPRGLEDAIGIVIRELQEIQ